MQAFAGPDSRERDVDVPTRLESGESNHALGKVQNPHRLAHIEYIDGHRLGITLGVPCRSDDKVARLTDCHEVADHLPMGDRERAARLDLRLELRHYRSVRG